MSGIDDLTDADFEDILPAGKAKTASDLVVTVIRLGKHKLPRVQFNFAPAVLAEIVGPRFDIAWAPHGRAFRIRAADLGRYEPVKVGRGEHMLLRCPCPSVGFVPTDETVEPEFYVDQAKRTILIEIGDKAFRGALPVPKVPLTTPAMDAHKAAVERARQAFPATSPVSLRK